MTRLCQANIKISKKLALELGRPDELKDTCYNWATQVCEDCGKSFCRHHNGRMHGIDKCEDTIHKYFNTEELT